VIKNIEYKYKKIINTLVLLINNLIRLFYKNSNPELKKIIKENRYTLSKSPSFLTSTQYKENNFGIPGNIFRSLDKPVNEFPTYSDMFIFFSRYLEKPINYLEIGVSVLKNFIQINESLEKSHLTGFDINPIAKNSNYIFEEKNKKNNTLSYFQGDVLNKKDTSLFKEKYKEKFNFVFSDALHEHDAVMSEYENIIKGNLDDEFILYFDDLDFPGLEKTVDFIYTDLKKEYNKIFFTTFYVNGWVGQHEKLHKNGLISTIDFYEILKYEKIKLPFLRKWN
tara:strand:- start:1274 stop:2113 length:840 start_codon:yes stop_codon:yes gene_type:complete